MPPRKWRNLSVREEVYNELQSLADELGIANLNDLLILLVRYYKDFTNRISKIEGELRELKEKVKNTAVTLTEEKPVEKKKSYEKRKSKKTWIDDVDDYVIIDVVKRKIRNIDAFAEWLRRKNFIVETVGDKIIAIRPEYLDYLEYELEEATKIEDLKDSKLQNLARLLSELGFLHYDEEQARWIIDLTK